MQVWLLYASKHQLQKWNPYKQFMWTIYVYFIYTDYKYTHQISDEVLFCASLHKVPVKIIIFDV